MIPNIESLPAFEHLLDRDEKILWTETPRFVPYLARGLGYVTLIFIFIIAINIYIMQDGRPEGADNTGRGNWIGLLVLIFFALPFIKRLLYFRNIRYACTNKRVMIRSGITGSTIQMIEFDKITELEVTANFVEHYYQVGTMKFYSGKTASNDSNTYKVYDYWEAIPNHFEVLKKVKEIMSQAKKGI